MLGLEAWPRPRGQNIRPRPRGLGLEGPGLGLEGLGLGLEANFEAEVKSLDTNIQQSIIIIIDKQRYSILDL